MCTTLAAAGITALAIELSRNNIYGIRLTQIADQYKRDGHEYIFVNYGTDDELANLHDAPESAILVDYWYSVLDGEPLILPVSRAFTESDRFVSARGNPVSAHFASGRGVPRRKIRISKAVDNELAVTTGRHITPDICDGDENEFFDKLVGLFQY